MIRINVNYKRKHSKAQGTNARKIISEVYAFFVLQCTVFGRKSKHKTDVKAWHGIHFHKNILWSILVIGNYYVNFHNYQNQMLLSSSDTRRTLMHQFLFTNSAQRERRYDICSISICSLAICSIVPFDLSSHLLYTSFALYSISTGDILNIEGRNVNVNI